MMAFLAGLPALFAACNQDHVGHVGSARLVILQPVPVADGRFGEDFRAALELLYPFRCHDSAYIQDRVYLERIDISPFYRREFTETPNLLRDFFGSNNPAKKRALREEMLFLGDTAFEKRPDSRLLSAASAGTAGYTRILEEYLRRNRANMRVYLLGTDTTQQTIAPGGMTLPVFHDPAALACRIVSDLGREEAARLRELAVAVILLPARAKPFRQPASPRAASPIVADRTDRETPGTPDGCPPDSTVERLNAERQAVITAFRNLLYYIATTGEDAALRQKFRDDALREAGRIPGLRVEGVPGGLSGFLVSDFGKGTVVTPLTDRCGLIDGVRIEPR